MRVAGRRLEVALIKIDDGRAGERVYLGRKARHGGGEENRKHQADKAGRDIVDQKRREDIVDLRGWLLAHDPLEKRAICPFQTLQSLLCREITRLRLRM